MVLEKLSQINFHKKVFIDGFIKGFLFCSIGTAIGFMFFPKNALLVGIFFSTIALMPSVRRFLSLHELLEGRVRKISGENIEVSELTFSSQKINPLFLLKENIPLFKFYISIFFGMIVFFIALFFVLPQNSVESLSNQIMFGVGLATSQNSIGMASFDSGSFLNYFSNNSMVLFAAFFIALFFGEGAIFIISWNAAYWATVFVLKSKALALVLGANPMLLILLIFSGVLIHMAFETLSYLMGIMSGGIISKGFSQEKLYGERFSKILIDALIILVFAVFMVLFAAWWESAITPTIIQYLVPNY